MIFLKDYYDLMLGVITFLPFLIFYILNCNLIFYIKKLLEHFIWFNNKSQYYLIAFSNFFNNSKKIYKL